MIFLFKPDFFLFEWDFFGSEGEGAGERGSRGELEIIPIYSSTHLPIHPKLSGNSRADTPLV